MTRRLASRRTLAGSGVVALTGLAIVTTALLVLPVAPAAADTQDFAFDSFDVDYYLALDAEGRTTLKTVETLVADFPSYDQNHGILRAIPDSFDAHPTDVHIVSVTDENGVARPFRKAKGDERRDASGFYQLVSRAPDFVHGRQTYVITYTQRNVTAFYASDDQDEFYWDLNGTGWDQYFGSVGGRVHIAPALAAAFTGAKTCYFGYSGSDSRCPIAVTRQSDGGIVATIAPVRDIQPGQTVTLALGFAPGTIVARDSSFFASPWAAPVLFGLLMVLAGLAWAVVTRFKTLRDARGRVAVVPEYSPPSEDDLLADAVLLGRVKRAAPAQLVDLAVRGDIRILEERAGFWKRARYTLEFVTATEMSTQEKAFARAYFDDLEPGRRYTVDKRDSGVGRVVYELLQTVRATVSDRYYTTLSARTKSLPGLLGFAGIVTTCVFGNRMIADARGDAIPGWLIAGTIVLGIVGIRVLRKRPLNPAGAELRDHLAGLRLYLRLAEAERLRVLQSPSGVGRSPVSASDPHQVLRINEKLLPYAILFGLEREWAAELGQYYEGSPPEWYSGAGAFSTAVLVSGLGGLSTSALSTVASFASSGSSGSGGGFGAGGGAGGGGGGGGGGGV